MSPEQLLELLQDERKLPSRNFLLIDLRRSDHKVRNTFLDRLRLR